MSTLWQRDPWIRFFAVLGIGVAPLVITLAAMPLLMQRHDNLAIDALLIAGTYGAPLLTLAVVVVETARYVLARHALLDDERTWRGAAIRAAVRAFVASLFVAFVTLVGAAMLASL